MSIDTALALTGFAFAMSISPGPANFLLLASGANFGYLRSLPLLLGISLGFLAMVFLVGMGLGELLRQFPVVNDVLKLACAGFVLWLAWKIANSRTMGGGEGQAMARPLGFVQAALFQLVNPKAWAVALIVTVGYTDPDAYLTSLLLLILLFAVVNLPSISVWAISGVALRRLLGEGRRIVVFNIAMALLLVASMVPVLLGGHG
ncbi:LysE family translocator [Oceanibacterium hippocampi]|uniref:Cysteine/O-acetylserine efflux protein n=1 Tax=Oceanibacterium hippocampi TaxID=745714 RepID=A0A1Y5SQB7_9PROT|nr:LysE family translocator [Oceanibacterium hippocampi]SLN44666.1 Cysteine/O-acetylserine efflux protein [Oceanibacterium hippocampi]